MAAMIMIEIGQDVPKIGAAGFANVNCRGWKLVKNVFVIVAQETWLEHGYRPIVFYCYFN